MTLGKVKQYRRGIGAFIGSDKGQRFFNFAYSIGAAIVIWGALFKILHLPGGNTLLSVGMGTEVLMFVLTAFDRPPRDYKWENVFPDLDSEHEGDGSEAAAAVREAAKAGMAAPVSGEAARSAAGIPAGIDLSEEDSRSLSGAISKMAAAADQLNRMAELTQATQQYLDRMVAIAGEMEHLRETTNALNTVSDTLLASYQAITQNSENITRSSQGYVEQMQNLNNNITGLNTIYEIQLRSISSQLDAIDRVNRGIKDIRDMYEKSANNSVRYCEETEKMARNMQQLNSVYEKMLTAMTINMYRPINLDDAGANIPGTVGINTPQNHPGAINH